MKSANKNQKEEKQDKVSDFVNFYKSAAKTNLDLSKTEHSSRNVNKENSYNANTQIEVDKRRRSGKKKKNNNVTSDISTVGEISDSTTDTISTSTKSSTKESKANSNLKGHKKDNHELKVKSIMKNSLIESDDMDEMSFSESYQRKKRNKSVSFRLEDNEEVALKKTKSDEPIKKEKEDIKQKDRDLIKEFKKYKKAKKLELKSKTKGPLEQNQMEVIEPEAEPIASDTKLKQKKIKPEKISVDPQAEGEILNEEKKTKHKKTKKEKSENGELESVDDNAVPKEKKPKKKKRKAKHSQSEAEGDEPAIKSRKKEVKPEKIAKTLENLTIGDNPHTLTNLLDEMTVADKNKHKKVKKQMKKDSTKTISPSSSEVAELENIEEGKEKIKWKKRKWNKDKKGEIDSSSVATVVIENLPLSIMCNYKKLLTERFGDYGPIKKIGIAEVYPTEESRPVFTTTVAFENEEGAAKALEDDNTMFEGSRIRISRPLPPTQTTIVVRSYAHLSDQNLSSVFTAAGKIRNIRHLVKGKNTKATSFIEFHNPEAVERALNMAEDAKIGSKNVYIARFEVRTRSNKASEGPNRETKTSNETN